VGEGFRVKCFVAIFHKRNEPNLATGHSVRKFRNFLKESLILKIKEKERILLCFGHLHERIIV
jgi:hypothetical protein